MEATESRHFPERQLCAHHPSLLGPTPCERCGNFLCEDCLFLASFQALCGRCASSLNAPQSLIKPRPMRELPVRYLNMGLIVGFAFGVIISAFTSFESGFFYGLLGLLLGFCFSLACVGLIAAFDFLYALFTNPYKWAKWRERRSSALKTLSEHSREMNEKNGQIQSGHCPRCEKESAEDSSGLCKDCVAAVEFAISRSSVYEADTPLAPPWNSVIRRQIAIGLSWILLVNLFLATMPLALRGFFNDWPALLTILIFASGVLAAGFAGVGELISAEARAAPAASDDGGLGRDIEASVEAIGEQAE